MIGTVLSATDKAVTEVTVVAHGPVAVVTHHDSLTEPEMDDDNVALKSLMIVPCLAAVTITPFRFHVKLEEFLFYYQHQDFEKKMIIIISLALFYG